MTIELSAETVESIAEAVAQRLQDSEPYVYLSKKQFAERIGVADPTLRGYKIPEPDVIIGPINNDGTLPRGTIGGWSEETVDAFHASRRRRAKD